ncbi:MAG: phosphate--acyl-ACP acyltransferase [Deltaproteobacteria bacterium]|nr:MAG: phosphate--acyl-ACP acyltransferase [Deltaproteobacteria bacterium]
MSSICVDACGGDQAPHAVVRAALTARADGVPVVLAGPADRLRATLDCGDLPILDAPEAFDEGLSPLEAIRAAPGSSVAVGLQALHEGRVSALVSCGPSGAVLLQSVRTLGVMRGLSRPALAVSLPRPSGPPALLIDAGANVDCRSEHLVDFARLGVAWLRATGREHVRVGLLSNGAEPGKGTAVVRAALSALAELGPPAVGEVVGQIEPHVALAGGCDVLVADGFVGNVMLKSLEAAHEVVLGHLRGRIPDAQSALGELSWSRFGAASLLGVEGLVYVGHGRSGHAAVLSAIREAHRTAARDPLTSLRATLGED